MPFVFAGYLANTDINRIIFDAAPLAKDPAVLVAAGDESMFAGEEYKTSVRGIAAGLFAQAGVLTKKLNDDLMTVRCGAS